MNAAIEKIQREVLASQKELVNLFESVTDDQDWQPAPGEWSLRFLAAHMATVDQECYQDRVTRIAAGEKPHFESYFNTGRDFSRFELKDSLNAWIKVARRFLILSGICRRKPSLSAVHTLRSAS
jgi:hypothetical protein